MIAYAHAIQHIVVAVLIIGATWANHRAAVSLLRTARVSRSLGTLGELPEARPVGPYWWPPSAPLDIHMEERA